MLNSILASPMFGWVLLACLLIAAGFLWTAIRGIERDKEQRTTAARLQAALKHESLQSKYFCAMTEEEIIGFNKQKDWR